jgi:hypothetical protein
MDGFVRLAELEAVVVLAAYVKAGIPVGGILLAGRVSPLYRLPTDVLCRWWSRVALLVAAIPIAAAALP